MQFNSASMLRFETRTCLQKYLERGGRFGQGQSAEKGCNDPSELGLAWVGNHCWPMPRCSGGEVGSSCNIQLACYKQQEHAHAHCNLAEGVSAACPCPAVRCYG